MPNYSTAHKRLRTTLMAAALLAAVAACGDKQAEQTAQTPAATAPTAAADTSAVAAKLGAMTPEQLREAATQAIAEHRLYAPAGDNAMEYYLALRDKSSGDAGVSLALTDLQPYTLIATEQAINRDDFAEAKRLYAMLEKTDAHAPALPRLKTSIADAESTFAQRQEAVAQDETRRAELERQRVEEQQRNQQQAAQQLAARQTEERRVAELREAETQRQQQEQQAAEARQAEERRQAEQRAAAQRQQAAAQPAPTPATPAPAPARANTELRPISTPQPAYPAEALRTGQSGSVQVEFTVGPNGRVTAARVVNANPPRVFNNEVLRTVRAWRFQPVDQPVTTRRTFSFNPQQ